MGTNETFDLGAAEARIAAAEAAAVARVAAVRAAETMHWHTLREAWRHDRAALWQRPEDYREGPSRWRWPEGDTLATMVRQVRSLRLCAKTGREWKGGDDVK